MRRSLIIYLLLLPLLSASSVQIAAAMRDDGSSLPWSKPAATTSENIEENNGVSVGNLFTTAPRFDSVASAIVPILGLGHGTDNDDDRFVQPPKFLLYLVFLI